MTNTWNFCEFSGIKTFLTFHLSSNVLVRKHMSQLQENEQLSGRQEVRPKKLHKQGLQRNKVRRLLGTNSPEKALELAWKDLESMVGDRFKGEPLDHFECWKCGKRKLQNQHYEETHTCHSCASAQPVQIFHWQKCDKEDFFKSYVVKDGSYKLDSHYK